MIEPATTATRPVTYHVIAHQKENHVPTTTAVNGHTATIVKVVTRVAILNEMATVAIHATATTATRAGTFQETVLKKENHDRVIATEATREAATRETTTTTRKVKATLASNAERKDTCLETALKVYSALSANNLDTSRTSARRNGINLIWSRFEF